MQIQLRSADQLIREFPRLKDPVIDGLLRSTETANLIAASKVGKSWLVYDLAYCVANGRQWLERFDCVRSKVLLIDNELHPESLSGRLRRVGQELDLPGEDIDVLNLRGHCVDLYHLAKVIDQLEAEAYGLVIADAFYRFLPDRVDENSNGQITALYNRLDEYTAQLRVAWVNIHHASKGLQADKAVTDVGSGAGAQSRAADTHIVLRPHKRPNAVVLEAAVRSFAPIDPVCLEWDFPLWTVNPDLDPTELYNPAAERAQKKEDETERRVLDVLREHAESWIRQTELISKVPASAERCRRVLYRLSDAGRVTCRNGQRNAKEWRLS